MSQSCHANKVQGVDEIEFSSPDLADVMEKLPGLVFEIRNETSKRIALYERSLGLLVIPVLLRRFVLRTVHAVRNPRS